MEGTTRIVDLPENITVQMVPGNAQFQGGNNSGISGGYNNSFDKPPTTNYAPMNVHPNPYGNSIQPNIMPLPQDTQNYGQGQGQSQGQGQTNFLPPEQHAMLQNMPQVRLPSRDIPMDQTNYQNDEEIQPNYIPRPKLTKDYVKQYEYETDENIRKHEKEKKKANAIDRLLYDLQIPVLVSVLFFFFQMPMINTMFYKNFSFLAVYNSDGNINFYGILLKSMLFGSIFYSLQKTVNFLTDF
jgi:hypothetical protein